MVGTRLEVGTPWEFRVLCGVFFFTIIRPRRRVDVSTGVFPLFRPCSFLVIFDNQDLTSYDRQAKFPGLVSIPYFANVEELATPSYAFVDTEHALLLVCRDEVLAATSLAANPRSATRVTEVPR